MLTREEIIHLAREAGCDILNVPGVGQIARYRDIRVTNLLERFAAIVAAAEREACAQVCDSIEDRYQETECRNWPEMRTDAQQGAGECAAAIRARGEKGGE
ncbi:hypothetical protein [Chromobacterium haemolyticum]|uniref:Uncharacterized protein n=1 Tax=Chromobacterium haemolyticum TaxID=394935 RepID=A0A1W0D5Z8_9NEIS|nr:hypothetical protein [Chromobacterium haemolyticum]OQS42282.1 hypothetical protein B0T45_05675 [Chromobacterium haemolyticum]